MCCTTMAYLLIFLGLHMVMCCESIEVLWNIERLSDISQCPTDLDMVELSPIACVVTAMTYNRSTATYDWSTNQCTVHDTASQSQQTTDVRVIYINGTMEDRISSVTRSDTVSPEGPESVTFPLSSTTNNTIPDITTCDEMTDTGVYRVTPTPGFSFLVNCEMDSEGLPWTVIQNRQSADVDFYRVWDQYKHGFGNISGNFWLGNDNIFILTRNSCALRIDMQSLNGTFGYAEYSHFQIANETEGYKLSISGFTGKFRDSFRVHHGYKFSTLDRDNDKDTDRSCAEGRGGAWWYRHCADVNLNGMYNPPKWRKGIYWQGFYNDSESVAMKTTKMAVKC